MRIYVKVVPRSSRTAIEQIGDHEYKVWFPVAPEGGRANERLIGMLADHFGISRGRVHIVGGRTTRMKMVDVDD